MSVLSMRHILLYMPWLQQRFNVVLPFQGLTEEEIQNLSIIHLQVKDNFFL